MSNTYGTLHKRWSLYLGVLTLLLGVFGVVPTAEAVNPCLVAPSALKTCIAIVEGTVKMVDTPRSVTIVVNNDTSDTFTMQSNNHSHGGFDTPPPFTIPPGKAAVFSSTSTGHLTGTEGWVTYTTSKDGGNNDSVIRVRVYWDNPWAGGNSCNSTLIHNQVTLVRVNYVCGSGNQKAHMAYRIHTVPRELYPGCANDIAVGRNGDIWVAGCNLNEFPSGGNIRKWSAIAGSDIGSWGPVVGHGLHVAEGSVGAFWTAQKNGAIQHYLQGTNWQHVAGCAEDIAVGWDNSVWVVGCNINDYPSGGNIRELQNKHGVLSWSGVVGHGLRIAAGPHGELWVAQKNGAIQKYLGHKHWHQAPGCAKDIAIGGDDSVWIIGCDRLGASGFSIMKYVSDVHGHEGWHRVAGASTDIAVGPDGSVWTVNFKGEIAHLLYK